MQGLQALTVRQVSCLSEGWRISQLGRRGAREGASAAPFPPSTSVAPAAELPAATATSAHFRLHPPEAAAASASPGTHSRCASSTRDHCPDVK